MGEGRNQTSSLDSSSLFAPVRTYRTKNKKKRMWETLGRSVWLTWSLALVVLVNSHRKRMGFAWLLGVSIAAFTPWGRELMARTILLTHLWWLPQASVTSLRTLHASLATGAVLVGVLWWIAPPTITVLEQQWHIEQLALLLRHGSCLVGFLQMVWLARLRPSTICWHMHWWLLCFLLVLRVDIMDNDELRDANVNGLWFAMFLQSTLPRGCTPLHNVDMPRWLEMPPVCWPLRVSMATVGSPGKGSFWQDAPIPAVHRLPTVWTDCAWPRTFVRWNNLDLFIPLRQLRQWDTHLSLAECACALEAIPPAFDEDSVVEKCRAAVASVLACNGADWSTWECFVRLQTANTAQELGELEHLLVTTSMQQWSGAHLGDDVTVSDWLLCDRPSAQKEAAELWRCVVRHGCTPHNPHLVEHVERVSQRPPAVESVFAIEYAQDWTLEAIRVRIAWLKTLDETAHSALDIMDRALQSICREAKSSSCAWRRYRFSFAPLPSLYSQQPLDFAVLAPSTPVTALVENMWRVHGEGNFRLGHALEFWAERHPLQTQAQTQAELVALLGHAKSPAPLLASLHWIELSLHWFAHLLWEEQGLPIEHTLHKYVLPLASQTLPPIPAHVCKLTPAELADIHHAHRHILRYKLQTKRAGLLTDP
jgi:hypothetical protein